MGALDLLLAAFAAPVLLACGYLAVLALFAWPKPAERTAALLRFTFLVPAHDEEGGIARTVRSLSAVDYPEHLREVLVVADNCADQTAARAREAGAEVLVRFDPERRGKGHALAAGFARILARGFADAVVVVDADSEVDPSILRAFAARLARGERACQAAAGVLNPDASWRTRLMVISLTLFNGVRSMGRERLGLSCGLRGNGMCLTTWLLRTHSHGACSLVEDLEYGIALGRAGIRVSYVPEASVRSQMASSGTAAASQRVRWERGRAELARRLRGPLLREAIFSRSALKLDLALDLFVPPLARLATWLFAGLCVSGLGALALGFRVAPAVWGLCALCFVIHLTRGLCLPGVRARALLAAPRYLLWKATLRRRKPDTWVRTMREEGR